MGANDQCSSKGKCAVRRGEGLACCILGVVVELLFCF
jgi:hypothetical protein